MSELAVIGLGLIGGSFALALKQASPGLRVTGIDVRSVVDSELARRVGDELVDIADTERVTAALSRAELTLLAAPVAVIERQLPLALAHARLVTDAGSTKDLICRTARELPNAERFVPGHPMAGAPEGGLGNARADLFRDRTWILCPEGCDEARVAQVRERIERIGARIVTMTPAEHDAAVARTSHLPQLIASALAVLVEGTPATPARGPAYAAVTRGAGGPEAMWRDIFTSNACEISGALRELIAELEKVERGLAANPTDLGAAEQLLARARALRNRS